MANDMACELFGYPDTALVGERLSKLLSKKHIHQGALDELDVDPETGDIIQVSGRIVSFRSGLTLNIVNERGL